jgi:type I restriction enzyme S subunit
MDERRPLGFEHHDVPPSWRLVDFTEAVEVNHIHPVPLGATCAYLTMAAVRPDGRGIGGGYERRRCERVEDRRFLEGDTLFAKISPCCENGKVAFARDLPTPLGLASKEFHVFSPSPEFLVPEYLFLLARSGPFREHARSRLEGITERLRVPPKAFSGLPVALPPLEEQRVIVDVVVAADGALERAEGVVERALEVQRALARRLLSEGLGHRGSVETSVGPMPAGWRASPIGELARVREGTTLKRSRLARREVGTTPAVTSGESAGHSVHEAEQFVEAPLPGTRGSSLLPIGTLVVLAKTRGRTRGTAALLEVEAPIGGDVLAILPSDALDSRLLLAWLECNRETVSGGASGVVSGSVSRRHLESLVVPVPPADEQRAIVERLDAVGAAVERSREEVERLSEVRRGLIRDLLTGRVRVRMHRG